MWQVPASVFDCRWPLWLVFSVNQAWEAAVALLQEGCSKIADLQMISGLSSLCKDMAVRRISLQHLILEVCLFLLPMWSTTIFLYLALFWIPVWFSQEVQSRVYLHARASDPMGDADDDLFYDEMDSSPGISVEIHRRMSSANMQTLALLVLVAHYPSCKTPDMSIRCISGMDVNSGGRPLSKTGPRHQRSRSSVRSGSCGRNREVSPSKVHLDAG